jgi:hypothetical protein
MSETIDLGTMRRTIGSHSARHQNKSLDSSSIRARGQTCALCSYHYPRQQERCCQLRDEFENWEVSLLLRFRPIHV